MKSSLLAVLALGAGLILSGCANTIKYDTAQIQKVTATTVSLDEFRKSTQSMVSALIESPEVKQAVGDKRPVVAVFGLVDLTSEGVDIASLNSGILNDLNRAARFRFADSAALGDANEQLNPNLYDLLENPAASKGLSQAVSADYLLIGEISNLVRTHPQSKEVYYRVSLKLVDAQSDQFLWQENREFLKSQKKVVHGI